MKTKINKLILSYLEWKLARLQEKRDFYLLPYFQMEASGVSYLEACYRLKHLNRKYAKTWAWIETFRSLQNCDEWGFLREERVTCTSPKTLITVSHPLREHKNQCRFCMNSSPRQMVGLELHELELHYKGRPFKAFRCESCSAFWHHSA